MEGLQQELAGVRQQLEAQSRQWYLHEAGCRCMVCVAQLEMQQLKQQVRTLTLALSLQQHNNQAVQHQQQHRISKKGRRRMTDSRGHWHNLPRPRVTVRMKVAAILAEKAASGAQVRTWAQVAAAEAEAATADTAVAAIAAEEEDWHDCQDIPERRQQQQQQQLPRPRPSREQRRQQRQQRRQQRVEAAQGQQQWERLQVERQEWRAQQRAKRQQHQQRQHERVSVLWEKVFAQEKRLKKEIAKRREQGEELESETAKRKALKAEVRQLARLSKQR
jgi:hypothetical protein